MKKKRAPSNRTLTLLRGEKSRFLKKTITLKNPEPLKTITDKIIYQNTFKALRFLPDKFCDLLVVDPPYNLTKHYSKKKWTKKKSDSYEEWLDCWIGQLPRVLKADASVYICCDWQCSSIVRQVCEKYFTVRNRITWEREKGRGSKNNWKNCSEDIWFCTMSDDYNYNVDAVKMKRKVLAPYRQEGGSPKDWNESDNGNYRLTYPSNLWTDITIPFWSMPENTDHPTQKPEKLIAKLILASSNEGDIVFDPFSGSGTTPVVAKKLGRHFVGIEQEAEYCAIAHKRLKMAEDAPEIQGYSEGVFWERNSLGEMKKSKK